MTRDDDSDSMRDVSHTNPYTGETFTTVYERGPAVADGGERADGGVGTRSPPEMTGGSDTMADVDHTPPHGEGANEVWKRGVRTTEDSGDVDE